jgi:hypothetical protein
MKNQIIAIVGLALLAAVPAFAQSIPTVRVDVPFAFQAGDRPMPAGTYMLREQAQGLVNLRREGTNAGAFISTHPATAKTASTKPYVLFDQIGDRYFLAGVWSAGSKDGARSFPSRHEKEALQSLNQASSLTTLAINTIPER